MNNIKSKRLLNELNLSSEILSSIESNETDELFYENNDNNNNNNINDENPPLPPPLNMKKDVNFNFDVNSMLQQQTRFQQTYLGIFTLLNETQSMKRFQKRIYFFLERPAGNLAFFYRCFIALLVLISILFSTASTIAENSIKLKVYLYWFDLSTLVFFLTEYSFRVWSSGCRRMYRGVMGTLRFMRHPILLTDITAILLGFSLFFAGTTKLNGKYCLSADTYPYLFLAQFLRFFCIDRKGQAIALIYYVYVKHKLELTASLYYGFIILMFSSFLVLEFEKEKNENIKTFSDAIYWSLITMTTIGYGDKTPLTYAGRSIASILCVIGISFWTFRLGIIGSGLALKVDENHQQKHLNRLFPAAASLIQTWWRMKIAYNTSILQHLDIDSQELSAMRTICILKFSLAKKSFKSAFTPYDAKNVVDMYNKGKLDILIRLKDILRKYDQNNVAAHHYLKQHHNHNNRHKRISSLTLKRTHKLSITSSTSSRNDVDLDDYTTMLSILNHLETNCSIVENKLDYLITSILKSKNINQI